MRLNVVITAPRGVDPQVQPGLRALDRLTAAAQALEGAGVTALVLDTGPAAAGPQAVAAFEPTTLAGALARATSTLGIVAADSALFGYPYNTARRLATLDHMASGWSGWRVVPTTEPDEEAGFGLAVGGTDERIGRAAEFVEVVLALWACWEPGAQIPDKATGDFQDDSRIHPINHRSGYYLVHGPLDVPRCPQGRPVVVQAVRTLGELRLAARFADVVEPWGATEAEVAATVSAVRSAASAAGRDPAELVVLPAVGWRAGSDVVAIGGGPGMRERVAEFMRNTGADGVTLVGEGTLDWVEELVTEVLPALRGLLTAAPRAATLAEQYGLHRCVEYRRAA
jgi:alkanesulfonate monooxygenase SsuD/methylene tetrahydromethanopterin reductase-like flavin-dependent oxidoreductase (luciferase family)